GWLSAPRQADGNSQPRNERPTMENPLEPPSVLPSELTPRERRITPMLAQGWSDDEIAVTLQLTPETVELHRASVYRKFGTDEPFALALWVMRHQVTD
ncbi:MAG: helix-turn-helix transcriptional regulator, partial [Planctomycetes bacterium]|nr:helix-turn-helix transcriptional regulator [Planctomycetota bacterium]